MKLYIATVIGHSDTCDGHARILAQGTKEECEKAIEKDKEHYAKSLMASTFEEDAITENDFCVSVNEIWYAPDGENDYTTGRIYDLLDISVPVEK